MMTTLGWRVKEKKIRSVDMTRDEAIENHHTERLEREPAVARGRAGKGRARRTIPNVSLTSFF